MDKYGERNRLNLHRILKGQRAAYQIVELVGSGGFGDTYKGIVLDVEDHHELLQPEQAVIIKSPTLDPKYSYEKQKDRLAKVYSTFLTEYTSLQRLTKVQCVAHVLDFGDLPLKIRNVDVPVLYIVQEFVHGKRLDKFLDAGFGDGTEGSFSGLPSARSFFEWAKKITTCVLEIHQQQVIHGDIWYENIMVDERENPIIIDFGQALFRELTIAHSTLVPASHEFVPPEGSGSVSGDVYSLGGVLYYLATGRKPPFPIENIDELKERVVNDIKKYNQQLYEENCGIADVIARCLRFYPDQRNSRAADVFRDIEIFSSTMPFAGDASDLEKSINDLSARGESLFCAVVKQSLRRLILTIQDMQNGIYDLTGDHDDIVSALAEYLSFIDDGDAYLTISFPQFWHSKNLGINGRFLAMNRLAAERGATVRRIFLITPEDKNSDPEIRKIVTAHLRVMEEVRAAGKPTEYPDFRLGGYFTGFKMISKDEREAYVKEGKHFGLVMSKGKGMLMLPIYRGDGIMTTVQFRTNADTIDNQREYFFDMLKECSPLTDYIL